MAKKEVLLLADRPSLPLARETCDLLKARLMPRGITFSSYPAGERRVHIDAGVRGKTVLLFMSFVRYGCHDPNIPYLDLLLANDALKRAGAKVIDVLPFIPYLRQDKAMPGDPVPARLLAEATYRSGASMVVTVDAHSRAELYPRGRILGTERLFANYLIHAMDLEGAAVVAPDKGAIPRAKALAKLLSLPAAACKKARDRRGRITSMRCARLPKGARHAIIYDDMVDSGGTILRVADTLRKRGISRFTVCCAHALLTGDAAAQLKRRKMALITTDSVPLPREGVVLSLAETLAAALKVVA